VIFASGYYDIEQAKALLANGRSGFLQKPFNMQQLSTKIRDLLDKPRTI
jgi:DNA-binding NtrC family response regulator